MEKTTTGLKENIAGLLCYVGAWISGIVFLVIEKENKNVRFHAMQSIVVFGVLTVAQIVLNIVGGIAAAATGSVAITLSLGAIMSILWIVCWAIGMIQAYQGKRFKFPWAGNFAEKQLKQGSNNTPQATPTATSHT